MADEGPDESRLAEKINRKPKTERAEQTRPGDRDSHARDTSDKRPPHDRRVHPESGGREPERDY